MIKQPQSRGTQQDDSALADALSNLARPLQTAADLDPLLDLIGDADYVLLGEASHGTSEYYTWRARLSKRLLQEKGFSFIAVEGDWPDCYAINRFIKHYEHAAQSARDVLATFTRWPTWMWANWEIVALIAWLRTYNDSRPPAQQVGFYGLDVYSLRESLSAVVSYLETNMPEALGPAKEAYRCFEPYGENGHSYAFRTAFVPNNCEDEVVDLLLRVRQEAAHYPGDPEGSFNAEQNAWVAVGAERYYRTILRGSAASWNIRDVHMADTLDRLMDFHARRAPGSRPKAIIWAHNTHIGDARATDMARANMTNVGQLVRERHSNDGVVLVGFGSYHGTVIAGDEWSAPMRVMTVPPAQPHSWEDLLHRIEPQDKLYLMDDLRPIDAARAWRGHRAIGVVYDPDHEAGNYVPTRLPDRYDAFLFLDETHALNPLRIEQVESERPDLFPWGL